GWSASNSTCVLSQVNGNLGEGGYFTYPWDVPSVAAVRVGSNGHYFIIAHGGAYESPSGGQVWAQNPVEAGAICVPYKTVAGGQWKTTDRKYGPARPVRITGLAANRRCFLTGITGGSQNFTHPNDGVQVVQIKTPDATHPTAGWYVQGTVASNPYTGAPSFADAGCIDFPSINAEWAEAFGGGTDWLTTGNGVKMCGLTGVFGAFNVNSYTDGATINQPSTLTGTWTLTVATNKSATTNCIQ
ncbi:MAG: hypothetical protein ABI678_28050, partial [Kofleriaceae bacterium]